MANTRNALQQIAPNVDESMGVRRQEIAATLSPIAVAKDVGRTPLRKFGRLRLEQIEADPSQPRTEFDAEEIQRLASSIRTSGQLHPIRVRWNEDRNKWIVVTGERRLQAAHAAGLAEIDCYFHDEALTESEILEQQLVENLLRQDLKPMEEARGYSALMELNGWNGKQVAEALRVSPSRVSRALALLDLPAKVQQRIAAGELSRSSAYELSKLENDGVQIELAEPSADRQVTQRQTAKRVQQRRGKSKRKRKGMQLHHRSENGLKVSVSSPHKCNYHDVVEALEQTLEEFRMRRDNNIQII